MRKRLVVLLYSLITTLQTFAQIATNQDCPNAIPLCNTTYSTVISYSGTGNIPNEINPGSSCLLSGERNDVWYTFTTPFFGNLSFTITPNNPNDDYDWAVYNLTNNTCADIYNMSSLEVSCNYAPNLGCGGTTGPNNNTGGPCGGQNNSVIPVTPGQTYVINVSNFSQTQSGYSLDFSASTGNFIDVYPPILNSTSPISCGSNSTVLTFNENILCSSVQPTDFVLTGPGGPYTITGVSSPNCVGGTSYSRTYTVTFSPAISTAGAYNFAIVSPVQDLCGNNCAVPNNRSFVINGVTLQKAHTNVTCGGDNDGTITLTPTGVGPFTYQWTPNVSSSNTATNLFAGTYTITVSPSNGACAGLATITVTEPPAITLQNQNIVSAICGSPSGSIATTIAGGTGAYQYSWSPSGGTSATASNLLPGNYTLSVTDALGCDLEENFIVPDVNNLNVAVTGIQNVTCFNGSNGGVSISPTGASPAVTYLWSNGAVTQNLSNVPAGSYSVTVTDGACQFQLTNLTVIQPSTAVTAAPLVTGTTCGLNNGAISLNASGGTGALNYQWSPSGSGANSLNLASGSYTITITDANGCTSVRNLNVGTSSAPTPTVNYAQQMVSCFNGSNGNATISAINGTAPYNYMWSGGLGTGSNQSNLSPGNYAVTVTDALGCTGMIAVTITNAPQLMVMAGSIQHVKCYGQGTGSATLNAAGGTGLLTYLWSPSGGTNPTATNLSAGNYSVLITDANGCTAVANFIITQPAAALSTSSIQGVATTCGLSNGTAAIQNTGGTTPYTYIWSNGTTTSSLSALAGGTYTVTVTDANLCSLSTSVNIGNSSAPVIATSNIQTPLCFGNATGSISINVNGGVLPYNYSWSGNVSNSATASNLPAGNYTVTITDQLNCTASGNYAVIDPAAFTFQNTLLTHVNCFGQNTGNITTNVAGGTGSVTYLWSTGNTTNAITNLSAGTYTLTATDQNNCSQSQSFTITQPAIALSSQLTPVNTSCGLLNGTLNTQTVGGTSPYQYAWSNGQSTASLVNISAGTYSVIITDSKGCTFTQSATIAPSTAPVIQNPIQQNLICAGINSGSIGIMVVNGTAPYLYLWNTNANTASINNLAAGNYTVTVTDASNCSVSASYQVTSPPAISIQLTNQQNVFCYGGNNGELSITSSGGTGNLQYSWSPGGSNSSIISNLIAGNYTILITDQNGCSFTQSYSITQPASALSNTITPVVATSCGLTNGSARAVPVGGTAPYKYLWSNGANTAQINNLSAGNYSVIVSDFYSCSLIQTTVIQPSSAVTVFSTTQTNALCNGSATGTAQVNASGGIAPYTYAWSSGQNTAQISGIVAGNYAVTITDQAGCTANATYIITQPLALQITMPNTQTVCSGQSASLNPQFNGGTPPYQYAWNTGNTSPSISINPTSNSTYYVLLTDANGCTLNSQNAIVNVFPQLSISSLNNATVCEGTSLTFVAQVTGGDGIYQYNWGNGFGNNATNSQLFTATTTVVLSVTDGCAYSASTNFQVNVVPMPIVKFSHDISIGCVPLDVNYLDLTVAVTGSTYQWDFGNNEGSTQTGSIAYSYPTAGKFIPTLTVTTPMPERCKAIYILPAVIEALERPIANFSFNPEEPTILNPVIAFKNQSIFANTYTWNFGDGSSSNEESPNHGYSTIGNYTVLLTASNLYCEDTTSRTFEITDQFSFYIPQAFSPNNDGKNDVFTAYSTNIVSGYINIFNRWGTKVFSSGYPFSWNGNLNTSNDELPQGIYVYSLKVTDKFGNSHSYSGTVTMIR
jgi:gliding motility-associated-like protein